MLDEHTTRVFYQNLFMVAGMPQPEMPCTHPTKKEHDLAIGWPALKIAIAYEGDGKAVAAFRKSDWEVLVLTAQSLSAAEPFLRFIADLGFKRQLSDSRNAAKQTVSHAETKLLEALLRAGLPEADRNFAFEAPDGRCTVPDFVWHDVRLAVFVDGWEWHGGRERREIVAEAISDPLRAAERADGDRSKITKDAAVRRAMSAQGWRTLTVTDQELATDAQVASTAADIVAAYTEAQAAMGAFGRTG